MTQGNQNAAGQEQTRPEPNRDADARIRTDEIGREPYADAAHRWAGPERHDDITPEEGGDSRRGGMRSMGRHAKDAARHMGEQVRDQAEHMRDMAHQRKDEAESYLMAHPWVTLGAGFGAGVLIGLMLRGLVGGTRSYGGGFAEVDIEDIGEDALPMSECDPML